MMNNLIIVPDVHCRNFYKPVLKITDKPVVFLGDYMDPYHWEGFSDKEGIENLEEIFDYAKNNDNVKLLIGNHDCSWIWSRLGWERTQQKYYKDLHKLYRENINLLHPCYKLNDILFTHAGVCKGWIDFMNNRFKHEDSTFRLNQENIVPYIENEFIQELKNDTASDDHWYGGVLNSPIFYVGACRGGNIPYGGPVWSDFEYDYADPTDWNLTQIFSHTQRDITGSIGQKGNGYCVDSRALFEIDLDTKNISRFIL